MCRRLALQELKYALLGGVGLLSIDVAACWDLILCQARGLSSVVSVLNTTERRLDGGGGVKCCIA